MAERAGAEAVLWAWCGLAGGSCPASAGLAAWRGAAGFVSGGAAPAGVPAALGADGGAVVAEPWLFGGRVTGSAVREYRMREGAVTCPAGADGGGGEGADASGGGSVGAGAPVPPPLAGLAAAAGFLRDRAEEFAGGGLPWWPAFRQAAAALCETYEGCGFDLLWTDGAVVMALVQRLTLVLRDDGVLTAAPAPAGGAAAPVLARGRAELARLGLYAGGRLLAAAPVTGLA